MTKGRPRNLEDPRDKSGKLRPLPENARLLALVANARIEVLKDLGNPSLQSNLGIYHIQGKIGDVQKRAGDEWVELVRNHRRVVLDGLSGGPVMGAMERRSRSSGIREYSAELIKRIQEKFDKVRGSILMLKNGRPIMDAVDHLCIEDRLLSYSDLILCKQGLDRIAVVLDLTALAKSVKRRINS